IVSGTIGEETAVSIMKAGAHDYLIKDDLARFVPAVKRELEQAEIRRGRKQAEEALAASEAELRALFASMQDVVLVIDREGVYRKVAPTNLRLLAIPPAELLGKNLREVFPAGQAEEFIRTIQQVLAAKQTTRIEYEIPIGGQPMWFEASISPMDTDNTLWVAHDVSARKQAEDALAASEAKLRALVEQVPAIVYTESAETRETLYISPQVGKITGYTPAEWITDRYLWKKMVHPEDLAAVIAEDERTTFTHEPFYIEYRILTRDGRALWIHDEALMIQNQDGTPLFWQGMMHDITGRKQAEDDIRRRVTELEMLYQSGLALGQLLNPKEVGQKILQLLEEKLNWHHTRIRLYHP
ncbi:MAG: PAS domain S-box protein, partial [Anaerolineales bacterium]|nr:PAS domain S-box protein [Anaerolineales bacterium]